MATTMKLFFQLNALTMICTMFMCKDKYGKKILVPFVSQNANRSSPLSLIIMSEEEEEDGKEIMMASCSNHKLKERLHKY